MNTLLDELPNGMSNQCNKNDTEGIDNYVMRIKHVYKVLQKSYAISD